MRIYDLRCVTYICKKKFSQILLLLFLLPRHILTCACAVKHHTWLSRAAAPGQPTLPTVYRLSTINQEHLGMPLLCNMVGNHKTFQPAAHAAVYHALSYPKGGFPTLHHNEIRDFTGNLFSEVCHNVSTEPHLQPITGESLTYASVNLQYRARLDITANDFWGGRFKRTLFDVKVFNPYAPSNRHTQPSSSYCAPENAKKRMYEQRICEIEHSSFTPRDVTNWWAWTGSSSYLQTASISSVIQVG